MMAVSCSEYPQPTSQPNKMDEATANGKLAMEQRNYEAAIEHFGTALRLCIEANDGVDDHPQAAPFYARYGKALLEAAVQSSSLSLVNEATVQKNYSFAEGQDKLILLSDDEEEGYEEEYDDDDEEEEEEGDDNIDEKVNVDKERNNKKGIASENECKLVESDSQSEQNANNDEKAEEENDFDLAWQMLDTAKLLYSKQEGSEARINESSVLEDLADLSMETESFGQAISDYESAIKVLEKASASFGISRALASLHFKLGLALEYSSKVPEAIKSLEDARSLILSILKPSTAASAEGLKGKEKTDTNEHELVCIVKEIEGKLEELKSGRTLNSEGNLHEAINQAANNTGNNNNAATPSTTDQPVNDLTGLVKKRRIL